MSFNKGTTARFKVDVTGNQTDYTVKIYRLGYYQGNGAREIANLGTFTGVDQPACIDGGIGLLDCGNWSESFNWSIPSTAVSGLYLAKLTRVDNVGASHIAFVVRDDESNADLIFKTADATWQAYNGYGGNSLYTGNTNYTTTGRAPKVSYNRPFITRSGGAGGGAQEDWLFNAEYPMIRFLERNGYNVVYTTDVDLERASPFFTTDPTPALKHKIFLSIGHDEYWSQNQRDFVEEARDSGMHLAFFSGNEVYWRTRWENSIDGSGTPNRTLVCYKEGTLGDNASGSKTDPTLEWTGLWRDGCNFTQTGGCNPENPLTGQISWKDQSAALRVPSAYAGHRFWRNTTVADLTNGEEVMTSETVGYEWSMFRDDYAEFYPTGRVLLSSTTFNGGVHNLVLFRHSPSGSLIFGAGTVQWMWGLDENHDRGNAPVSPAMQQATINLLADMDVQPATIMPGMIAAARITDLTGPVTTIISPLQDASLPTLAPAVISGTATDADGIVAGVEISFNNGTTWEIAQGGANWTYNWFPQVEGEYGILVRAFDDMGNIETPAATVSVTVGPPAPPSCTCTIWPASTVPTNDTDPDNAAVELGVKFRSTTAGFITGIRFFKGPENLGTHRGSLWTSTGTLLATVTFTNETPTGWQEALFTNPVAIEANTTYVASYNAPQGRYSADPGYFTTQGFINNPLRALPNGEDGANGVYTYSSESPFPTETFQSTNYWVDAVFETAVGPDITPPLVLNRAPADGASGISISAIPSVTFNEAMAPASLENVLSMSGVTGTVSYNAGTRTLSFAPTEPLTFNTSYSLTLLGTVTDLAENPLGSDVTWSFTTGSPPPPPPTEGPGGPILVISSTSNDFSRFNTEILRNQGFNSFSAQDESSVNAGMLENYQVAILGDFNPSAQLVTDLTAWVEAGGTLIAFRPKAQLYDLMGILASGSSIAEGYILVNNAASEGAGIVNETIQYHGTADQYTLDGATSLATLYLNATTATTFAAITLNAVGTNGGRAYAFAYDLARSVIFTRQGNPEWEGQNRDVNAVGSDGVIRSNDLFYGDAPGDPQPDWVNLDKAQIPQADEQMHLLSNMITLGNLHNAPLPRFWMLPNNAKAAVVMTGDDHASLLTDDFFNDFIALSPNGCNVDDWECVRGSSYMYANTPQTDAAMLAFQNQGFEVGIHINTGCDVWTPASLVASYTADLAAFAQNFPSINAPTTHRTHCIAWSDYDTQAQEMLNFGMRLDANYYYWPESWIQNRPGLFTGSGWPMRFATAEGELIDVYQLATQFTDESGQTFPLHYATLIDNAIGPEGYYGVFCANFHTDRQSSRALATGLATYAQSQGAPVVSSRQMLTWLDGRNASSLENISWNGTALNFDVSVGTGANNLYGMVPANSDFGPLLSMTFGGSNLDYELETIKGVQYAMFPSGAGSYAASYGLDETAPVISNIQVQTNLHGSATITWTTNEPASSVLRFSTASDLSVAVPISEPTLKTSHSIVLQGLVPGTTYFYRVSSTDGVANTAEFPVSPATSTFDMPSAPEPPCASDDLLAEFAQGTPGANTMAIESGNGAVILKPTVYETFDANTLPATGWGDGPWNPGGTIQYSGGSAIIDGGRAYTTAAFGPGSVLEFQATFTAGNFQNIGFTADSDFNNPWVVIGRGDQGDNNIYARTWLNDTVLLGANLLNAPHLYKIEWNGTTNGFAFYVDGVLIPTPGIAITVSTNMIVTASDFPVGGVNLTLTWLKAGINPLQGVFESRVFDAGMPKLWNELSWDASLSAGTSVDLGVRVGSVLPLVGPYTPLANSGDLVNQTARYIQYAATLNSGSVSSSPILNAVTIACEDAGETAPVISANPQPVVACEGEEVEFTATATGNPAPTVQWQVSTDGGNNFADIDGAVSAELDLIAALALDGNQYRAIWSNGVGQPVNSAAALLTVNPLPDGALEFATPGICESESVSMQYAASSGTGPFDLVINGITYNGIESGVPFNPVVAAESLFDPLTDIGGSQEDDNGNTELGLQFSSNQSGQITGIRFYQTGTDALTFTGTLWTTVGAALTTGTVTTDGTSGWKTIPFSSPVSIDANTSYVASYTSPNPNFYAFTSGGLSTPITNGNLTGEASWFNVGGSFPNIESDANYWVDVLFRRAETLTFDFTEASDANGCVVGGSPISSITQSIYPNPAGTLSSATGTVCFDGDAEITFESSAGAGPFDLIINGTTYTGIQDGVPFEATPLGNSIPPTSIWTTTPTFGSFNDGDPIETGLKFQSSEPGEIISVRFFKGAAAAMPAGSLVRIWNTSGTQLASAAFTLGAETGWQVIDLSSPLRIDANTTYIASVYSAGGDYVAEGVGSLINEVVNPPLKALSNTEAGGNGVFNYGLAGFPATTAGQNNYGVDVVFTSSEATLALTSIRDANGCVVTGGPPNTLSLEYDLNQTTWYADTDGDGFGDPLVTQNACSQPTGYVANNTDCDDNNATINPNTVWYLGVDDDGDTFFGSLLSATQCVSPGAGYSTTAPAVNDCDDSNAAINPSAPEIYDGIDNDCDGMIDGADPDVGGQSLAGSVNISAGCSGLTIQIRVYEVDGTTMLYNISSTVDASGNFTVQNIAPGNYDIFVKMPGFLSKGLPNRQVLPGNTSGMNFGSLRPGDIDGNNNVGAIDLAAIVSAYNSTVIIGNYIASADFDCSGAVSIIDLSALLGQYNSLGDQPGNLNP